MKRKVRKVARRLPIALALLAAGWILTGAALAQEKDKKDKQVTVTGSFTCKVGTLAPRADGGFDLTLIATGEATHIGRATLTLRTAGKPENGSFIAIPPSTGELVTPNGDRIFGTFRWTVTRVEGAVLFAQGPFTLTGGTGRFAGASGQGSYSGSLNTANQTAVGALTATVTLK
jgi:hypothetical protein